MNLEVCSTPKHNTFHDISGFDLLDANVETKSDDVADLLVSQDICMYLFTEMFVHESQTFIFMLILVIALHYYA